MPSRRLRLLLSAGLVLLAATAEAKVYPCVGPKGERIVQDRPCPVVNPPQTPPPAPPCTLTPAELRQAVRQEEQFLKRYPDGETHRRAQKSDLEVVVTQLRGAAPRLDELRRERQRIDAELQFFPKGQALPPPLQARLDANEGSFAGLADTFRQLERAIAGIQSRYTCDRDTFAKMWTGAPAGSSGCSRPECARGWSLPP